MPRTPPPTSSLVSTPALPPTQSWELHSDPPEVENKLHFGPSTPQKDEHSSFMYEQSSFPLSQHFFIQHLSGPQEQIDESCAEWLGKNALITEEDSSPTTNSKRRMRTTAPPPPSSLNQAYNPRGPFGGVGQWGVGGVGSSGGRFGWE